MGVHRAIVIVLLVGIFTSHVYSSCFVAKLVSNVTKYGNIDQFCIYNDMKILPGSSFRLSVPDCLECKCTTDGLRCCGFGFGAGASAPPEGCLRYSDACHLIFVKIANPTERCYRTKSVNKPKKNRKISASRQT